MSIKHKVLADASEVHARSGQVVARRGEPAASWIGVVEGLLKISAVHRTGKVVMLGGIPAGSWVGEGPVIKEELRRYDIVAVQPSRIVHVPAPTVRWLLDTSIEFNRIIVSRFNERLGQYAAMLEIGRMTDPVARVARSIANLFNPVLHPQLTALLPLSQTELGELVGLSRQSVGAALRRLEAEGLVSMQYGAVRVLRLSALSAYEETERRSALRERPH